MALTKKDKDELNKAIAEYLYNSGFGTSYDSFLTEAEIDAGDNLASQRNILQTKWKLVAKLKKQIL